MIRRVLFAVLLLVSVSSANAVCQKNDISGGTTVPGCSGGEICLDGPGTKTINGADIYRDCWQCQAEYTCSGSNYTQEPYCQQLVNEGCTPIGQTCYTDYCTQTYNCPIGGQATYNVIDCGTQQFTMDGLPYDTSYPLSNDFGLAAANLGVIEEAVQDIDVSGTTCTLNTTTQLYECTGEFRVFEGDVMSCHYYTASWQNCCKDTGWGIDLSLAQCSTDEQILGYAKQGGLEKYIGTDCIASNIFGCYGWESRYCVFKSKLGRIIQEGAHDQLILPWGGYNNPNCDGLTTAQLQSLDFSLIDFSEFYADAINNIAGGPTGAQMETMINGYINQISGGTCSQFTANADPNLPGNNCP